MFKFFLSSDIVHDPKISGHDLAVYAHVQSMLFHKYSYVSFTQIAHYTNLTPKQVQVSMQLLIDQGYYDGTITKYGCEFNCLYDVVEPFSVANMEHINKIIAENNYKNLLKMYCLILVSRNKKFGYQYTDYHMNYYANRIKTTSRSIYNYVEKLHEMGLITVGKNNLLGIAT